MIKKLLTMLSVALLAAPLGHAAKQTVTATWGLQSKPSSGDAAVVAPTGVLSSSAITWGENLNVKGTQTYTVNDASDQTFTRITATDAASSWDTGSDATTLTFSVVPIDGINFTPYNLGFEVGTTGNSTNSFSVNVTDGTNTYTVQETKVPGRLDNNYNTSSIESYNLSNYTFVENPTLTVNIVFENIASTSKYLAFRNVVITGTYGDDDGEEEEPSDDPVVEECTTEHFHLPGTLWLENYGTLTHSGTRVETGKITSGDHNGEANIGYIKNGCYTIFNDVTVHNAGVYKLTHGVSYNNGGSITLSVIDTTTGATEVTTNWTATKLSGTYPNDSFLICGEIAEGTKNIRYDYIASHDGYCFNLTAPTFEKVADHYANVSAASMGDIALTADNDADFYMLLSEYEADTVVLTLDYTHGTLDADGATLDGSTLTISTPELNEWATVTLTLTPDDDAVASQTAYTVKLFREGQMSVKSLTIDSFSADSEVIADLNGDDHSATVTGYIFTAEPIVVATFSNNTTAAATYSNGTFTFEANDVTYTLNVEGIHTYTLTEADKTTTLLANGGDITDGTWSNGLYSIDISAYYNQYFKAGNGPYTLNVPGDVKVNQIRFTGTHHNSSAYTYAYITSVSSEGATVYLPSDNKILEESNAYGEILVNVENHTAGTPIVITLNQANSAYFSLELTYENIEPATPPTCTGFSTTDTTDRNHFVAIVNFDREITSAYATVGDTKVVAESGSAVLYFPFWDLDYNTTYTVTIPAGAVVDIYGNTTDSDITFSVTTGSVPVTELISDSNFVVVSTVEELKTAVDAASTRTSTTAERYVIFVMAGDYDLGTLATDKVGLDFGKCCNVSLVGAGKDATVIRGSQTGISNPIVEARYTTGMHIQGLTMQNDLDWDKDRVGVGAAFRSGDKFTMVDCALKSQQDTYVTYGTQGYVLNCDIYGAVDYICGGGDIYFDRCNLINTNTGYITAPNTSASQKWGYVFERNTISSYDGTEYSYNLGRPWQNEPKCAFLNTVMNYACSTGGWGAMGSLYTYFYEYNSMYADGTEVDLSGRKNSSTSLNSYNPVLTHAEAERFTIENVLGSTDSYLPTDYIVDLNVAKPWFYAEAKSATRYLIWTPVENALYYGVYLNDELYDVTSDTAYALPDDYISIIQWGTAATAAPAALANLVAATSGDVFSVAAANSLGGLGTPSNGVDTSIETTTTSLGTLSTASAFDATTVEYYDLQGQRVSSNIRGLVIEVTRAANGTASARKIIR